MLAYFYRPRGSCIDVEAGGSAGGSVGEKRPLPPARGRGGREASTGRWRSRPARASSIASLSPALERPSG